jgi:mono/diheme cytochrome c family protein
MKKTNLAKYLLFTSLFSAFQLQAQDWSRDVAITSPRENIYQLPAEQFAKKIEKGKRVALFYPVTVSDLLIPYHPLKNFFESDPQDPVRKVLYDLAKVVSPFKEMDDLYRWLGVHEFPRSVQAETPNELPELSAQEQSLPMGATLIQTANGEALTFGCAACHASDLFGVKVLGLTNRFPRANEFFRHGETFAPYVNSFLFKELLNTTEGERLMMVNAKRAVKWVGTKKPQALGLDTSLAQVALSLSRREPDAYATRSERAAMFPRPNKLSKMVADSKPAVWWNVKYKNRWLSDGSIVSGNPVHTNFLWNEIGRGTDLKKLERWMQTATPEIEALTAAVFATQAPRYENFFGVNSIDMARAKRGQKLFAQSCQKCHGVYEKGWDLSNANQLKKADQLKTVLVKYPEKTPVYDVGTDPGRYLGMREFADALNQLQISKTLKTVVEPQKGYVPPPLVGIWARWPYFHNNSIPNLCALFTPVAQRPASYYAGAAIDRNRDFDQECVGYPIDEKTPEAWKKNKDYFYDTRLEGLSNRGHYEKIFIKDGKELYSWEQKLELIEFLKTL